MKIVQINATCGRGSTGKICVSLSCLMAVEGTENYIIHSGETTDHANAFTYANINYIKLQSLKARLFGNWGFNSRAATQKIIVKLKEIKPDIVHLHNIHGHDCDLSHLLSYLKAQKVKVIWTFHDCWAFTGYCMHFAMAGCDKWQSGCRDCPLKKEFSWIFDRSAELQKRKKELTESLDLTVVTPSKWLADNVKLSFLKDKPVKVINNGIDLSVFRPTESDFRERYGIRERFMLLGVSFGWDRKKGLDVFIELSKRLGGDYRIVLVGTDDATDRLLPNNIISIHRTSDQRELAQIYTAADVFLNPTREENYPTVNMEAIACGTPVVTFCTGGSPEILDDTCGSVVDIDDIDAMQREIQRICTEKAYSREACVQRSSAFDQNERFKEYMELYKEIYDRTATN